MKNKPIIFVYGPTGSGKTDLSYKIINYFFFYKKLNGKNMLSLIKKTYKNYKKPKLNICLDHQKPLNKEQDFIIKGDLGVVINMDSKQIYYHLPDLTASPHQNDKKNIYHYLFNEYMPGDDLTVNIWYEKVIDFIDNTGFDYYLLVGGSSFYLKYFLTPNNFNAGDDFHRLINIFLCWYPWDGVINMFGSYVNRFQPHINDEFRKYNFLKNYFSQRFGKHLLPLYNLENKGIPWINPYGYSILIITLNPSIEILQNNIKSRAEKLSIGQLVDTAKYLHSNYVIHQNFSSIIGYQQLIDDWDPIKFYINTMKYAKTQKKWINYFLKNHYFGYNFFSFSIDY